VLPLASGAIAAGLEQLVAQVQSAIHLLQGRASIDLPAGRQYEHWRCADR